MFHKDTFSDTHTPTVTSQPHATVSAMGAAPSQYDLERRRAYTARRINSVGIVDSTDPEGQRVKRRAMSTFTRQSTTVYGTLAETTGYTTPFELRRLWETTVTSSGVTVADEGHQSDHDTDKSSEHDGEVVEEKEKVRGVLRRQKGSVGSADSGMESEEEHGGGASSSSTSSVQGATSSTAGGGHATVSPQESLGSEKREGEEGGKKFKKRSRLSRKAAKLGKRIRSKSLSSWFAGENIDNGISP